jgi:hypothetical protein
MRHSYGRCGDANDVDASSVTKKMRSSALKVRMRARLWAAKEVRKARRRRRSRRLRWVGVRESWTLLRGMKRLLLRKECDRRLLERCYMEGGTRAVTCRTCMMLGTCMSRLDSQRLGDTFTREISAIVCISKPLIRASSSIFHSKTTSKTPCPRNAISMPYSHVDIIMLVASLPTTSSRKKCHHINPPKTTLPTPPTSLLSPARQLSSNSRTTPAKMIFLTLASALLNRSPTILGTPPPALATLSGVANILRILV